MIKITARINNRITPLLKAQQQQITQIPKQAAKVFEKNTPIRSGFARRNTKLTRQKIIEANYPYAERLDKGWSKQSPQGMTQPTIENIQELFYKIMTGKK